MIPLQYIDSRSFPRCMVGNRPRPSRRTAVRRIPDRVFPAESIRELRDWVRDDIHGVEILYWSRGIPALAAPMRPRREARLDHPEEMTWQQIRDTVDQELPSISSEAFDELGTKVLSLNASSKFDDEPDEGTIAERIPAEQRERLALLAADGTPVQPEQLTPEQLQDLRSRLGARYGVAVDVPTPQIRQRIEWERFVARCDDITKQGFRLVRDDIQFYTSPIDRPNYVARKKAHIAAFLKQLGRTTFPTPKEFAQRRNVLRALARQYHWRENAQRLDSQFAQLDTERQWLIEREGGMSWNETEYEYTPSYAVLREAAWRELKPKGWVKPDEYARLRKQSRDTAFAAWKAAREAAQQVEVHRCRNPRMHGSKDEMWHSAPRDPDEFEIGFDWSFAS